MCIRLDCLAAFEPFVVARWEVSERVSGVGTPYLKAI